MKVETIISIILGIASIVTALKTIIGALQFTIKKWLDNNINIRINNFEILFCKTYITDFLSDLENGIPKDDEQYKVAHEIYDHYTKDLKQNSYIHDKWEKVIVKGG